MTAAIWIVSVPLIAEFVFAPVNLPGIAGAALAVAVCVFYLVHLAGPGRRDPAGLAGFALFGALAGAVLTLRTTA
jgi:hypothetical protein